MNACNPLLVIFGVQTEQMRPFSFIFASQSKIIYLLVYADDIIITRSLIDPILQFITKINTTFFLKNLDNLDYFLGVEVKHMPSGSFILTKSKSKNTRDFLTRSNMLESSHVSTHSNSLAKSTKLVLILWMIHSCINHLLVLSSMSLLQDHIFLSLLAKCASLCLVHYTLIGLL